MPLTWRDVAAPQLDLRGLSHASDRMSQAFGDLGQVFVKRDQDQRAELTNAALADVYMQKSLEGLDGYQMPDNPRINAKEIAQAVSAQRGTLLEQGSQREDLANKQAVAKFGTKYFPLLQAAHAGNTDAQQLLAADAEADPDGAGRFLAYAAPEIFGAYRGGVEDREKERSNRADETVAAMNAQSSRISANAAAQQARAQINNAATRLKWDAEDREVERAHNPNLDQGTRTWAATFTDRLLDIYKGDISPDDVTRLVQGTEQWKKLGGKGRDALLSEVADRAKRILTPTEQQLQGGPNSASGIASFLVSGRPSVQMLKDETAPVQARAAAAVDATTRTFLGQNPLVSVHQRANSLRENGEPTFEDVVAGFKQSGINMPGEEIEQVRQKYGLTNADVLALGMEFGSHDRSFGDRRGWSLVHGTNTLHARAAEYAEARRTGGLTKLTNDLTVRTAPFIRAQRELANAEAALERAAARSKKNGTDIPPALVQQARVAAANLAALARTAETQNQADGPKKPEDPLLLGNGPGQWFRP